MNIVEQSGKAEALRALHGGPGILLLPNIWDPLGARMLQASGFPAVATASAAVAYSRGYDDGEKIGFDRMLQTVREIAASVHVPLTADIERGYSDRIDGLAANVRHVIRAGAVGINLEDSYEEGGDLRPLEEQCERIRAARRAGEAEEVPLVINARTDVFLREAGGDAQQVDETVRRTRAYKDAGADCVYPIGVGDVATIRAILEAVPMPVNVYLRAGTAPLAELETAGVRRVSLGPNLLRAAYTAIRDVATDLLGDGSYERFTHAGLLTSKQIRGVLPD